MHSSKKSYIIFIENKEKILNDWEALANEKIMAARQTDSLALRDHLPSLLEAIAEIIEKEEKIEEIRKGDKYHEIILRSEQHGKHRAAMHNYTVDQLIHEYIIFHRVLTETLEAHGVNEPDVINLLKFTIETAMLKSCASFSESIQEMQEQLVGTLAHDIRNPLSAALSSLALIEKNHASHEELQEIAIRNVKHALSLTENLLDTITVQAGEGIMMKFEEADYVEEVKTVYNEAFLLYGERIVLDCPDKTVNGILDTAALKRVMDNLITNAIKYGYTSSPIVVRFRDLGEDVLIEINNQGRPIPEEKQATIFEFLAQDATSHSGSLRSWGIGLTLVKIVAEAHQGHVQLISTEEEGTTFSVRLKKKAAPVGKVRIKLNYKGSGTR